MIKHVNELKHDMEIEVDDLYAEINLLKKEIDEAEGKLKTNLDLIRVYRKLIRTLDEELES